MTVSVCVCASAIVSVSVYTQVLDDPPQNLLHRECEYLCPSTVRTDNTGPTALAMTVASRRLRTRVVGVMIGLLWGVLLLLAAMYPQRVKSADAITAGVVSTLLVAHEMALRCRTRA